MIIELLLMTVSAAAMIALLVHKHLEKTRGLETRAQEYREKTDPILRDFRHTTNRFFSHITVHNVILGLNQIFVQIVRFFMDVSHRAHKVSSDIVEKASKKTEDLSRAGTASFYLKQIKEKKDEVQSTVPPTAETPNLPKQ